jgi:hypothetical protein
MIGGGAGLTGLIGVHHHVVHKHVARLATTLGVFLGIMYIYNMNKLITSAHSLKDGGTAV